MRKLLFLFVMLVSIVACTDDDSIDDKLPIKGLKIPESVTPVKPGSPITIKGEGFTKASEIWFRSIISRAIENTDVKADVTTVSDTGITFTTPIVYGNQSVLLKESGKEYELGKMVFEEAPIEDGDKILPKKVKKVVVFENGNLKNPYELLYSYNEQGKIISETKKKKNEEVEVGNTPEYKEFVYPYKYENNSIIKEMQYSHKYAFELKDGKVNAMKSFWTASIDDPQYKEEHEEYAFNYNADNYLETVNTKWFSGNKLYDDEVETFVFVNGYVTKYKFVYNFNSNYHGEYSFEYGDSKKMNNVNIDLWGLIGDYCVFDSDLGEAFLLNVIGNRCKYLPVKIKVNESDIEDGKVETDIYDIDIKYVINNAGYVTKITITDNDETAWIFEIYYED